jgi:D-hydroxyproline dehydrogenase subunit beta
MSETADVIVVGGGIIGCAVVWQLAERLPSTARIVVIDRGPIAGATSGSCMGHLMVTPDDAQEYAFTKTSLDLWRTLHEQEGGFDYNPTGALYLADADEDVALIPVLKRQFAENGDRADELDRGQLRELEPGLADDIPGALFYPGDGVVLPMLACGAMLRVAQRRNPRVTVLPGEEVTGFRRAGDRITGVTTTRRTIGAPIVVNAAGVWSPDLVERLGLPRLPIHPRAGNLAITGHHVSPIRTQLLEISYLRFAHGAAKVDPTRTDADPGGHAVNMQPQTNGGCLIGSTRQFRGLDRTLNRELLETSLRRAQRYAPALGRAPIVRTWVGLRPYSIDKHPLIGSHPALPGLWIASGHEGLGISLAPITGRLLAEQITGQPTTIDATLYQPARFVA